MNLSDHRDECRPCMDYFNQEFDRRNGAHVQVHNAVKAGLLERQPCEDCGILPSEGHHDDYDKPLEVRWLCHNHHRRQHKGGYDDHNKVLRRLLSERNGA